MSAGLHALIVDDNPRNLKVLNQLLVKQGVHVTEVNDVTALEATVSALTRVDVVFIDLEMPVASGYDVLKYLRAHLGGVPMIACTVHVSEIGVTRTMGFDGFIAKPLDQARFPDQLARVLRNEAVWEQA